MPRILTHPGEVLSAEFVLPAGFSAKTLAAAIGVAENDIVAVVCAQKPLTADLVLTSHFGTTPEFWLHLQSACASSAAHE
jgi:addiction module HigA family antidote